MAIEPFQRTGATAWFDAYKTANKSAELLGTVAVPISEASGRILARNMRSLVDLPGYNASAMDGYAISGPGPWVLVSASGATPGRPWRGDLATGQAVPISTGAEVPAGGDRVVPIEFTQFRDGLLHAWGQPAKPHIRLRGEETVCGQLLAPLGSSVTPALLGLAAATGHDSLVVRQRARVLVMVTGDELVDKSVPAAGMVRDAISPILIPILAGAGAECVGVERIADSRHLELKTCDVDVVVVTGSTSVGASDRLRNEVAPRYRVVDGVDCRPGHPMLLARFPAGPWVIGLPGNPFAAFVAVHTLLVPLLAGMSGGRLHDHRNIRMKPSGRGTRVVPVRKQGNTWVVCPGHSAASLRGAALAQGLAVIEPNGHARLLRF